jgi:hypothetical protein
MLSSAVWWEFTEVSKALTAFICSVITLFMEAVSTSETSVNV